MALDLTLDPQSFGEQAHRWLTSELDHFVAAYEASFPDGGRILDPDKAKRLFLPGETRREVWIRFSGALHPPARQLIEELYRRRLGRGNADGLFVFTAGGPGSGKTSMQQFYRDSAAHGSDLASNPYHAAESILDSTFADLGRARAWVKAALFARKQVRILFVCRELAAAINGVIDRALDVPDRVVKLSSVVQRHFDAPKTLLATAAQFHADGVQVHCFRCVEGHPLSVEPIDLAEVERIALDADLAAMQHTAYSVLESRQSEIPPPLYDAFHA